MENLVNNRAYQGGMVIAEYSSFHQMAVSNQVRLDRDSLPRMDDGQRDHVQFFGEPYRTYRIEPWT